MESTRNHFFRPINYEAKKSPENGTPYQTFHKNRFLTERSKIDYRVKVKNEGRVPKNTLFLTEKVCFAQNVIL